MDWIKIVPNISEGREKDKIYRILKSFVNEGTYLIDVDSDPSHNRTVITAICCLENLIKVSLNFTEHCIKEIDINKHRGVHPRIGAVDVFPFVNFSNIDETIIKSIAKELANKLYGKFGLPVYFYGRLYEGKDKRSLSKLRNLGIEKLGEEIVKKTPGFMPDVGNILHPTAGAICIGLRDELIAYNIFLDTDNINIAKKIAHKIRESSGGFKGVQALGFFIEHLNKVQVSMNLTNYKITSIDSVYNKVLQLSQEENTDILMSEIVGLVPYEAIKNISPQSIKLKNFDVSQIFEYHLNKLGIGPKTFLENFYY